MSRNLLIYLIVFSLLLGLFGACLAVAKPAWAQEQEKKMKLSVPIGDFREINLNLQATACSYDSKGKCIQVPYLGQYINALYRYALSFGSILAVVLFMYGGLLYMLAGYNASLVSKAKEFMIGSVTGIGLLLASYVLLNTINPNLLTLRPVEIEVVKGALTPPKFCEDIVSSEKEYPLSDGSTKKLSELVEIQESAEGKVFGRDSRCGEQFPVVLNEVGQTEFTMPNSTKCTASKCPASGGRELFCAVQNSGYACVPALVGGTIATYQAVPFADLVTSTYTAYPEYVGLFEAGNPQAMAGYMQLGDGKDSYFLTASSRFESTDEYLFMLKTEVNDPTNAFSSDDIYFIDKRGLPVGVQTKNNERICCTVSCGNAGGVNVKREDCGSILFRKQDISQTPAKTNIDTNKFYCAGIPLTEMFVYDSQGKTSCRFVADQCIYDKDSCSVINDFWNWATDLF